MIERILTLVFPPRLPGPITGWKDQYFDEQRRIEQDILRARIEEML